MVDYMENHRLVEINDSGWIRSIDGEKIEPTHISDYGDYILSKEMIENAFDDWIENTVDMC
jgi:hypothetical protein